VETQLRSYKSWNRLTLSIGFVFVGTSATVAWNKSKLLSLDCQMFNLFGKLVRCIIGTVWRNKVNCWHPINFSKFLHSASRHRYHDLFIALCTDIQLFRYAKPSHAVNTLKHRGNYMCRTICLTFKNCAVNVSCVSPTISSDYFPAEHSLIILDDVEGLCSLWSRNWIILFFRSGTVFKGFVHVTICLIRQNRLVARMGLALCTPLCDFIAPALL
jgi:hypothetical protein